MSPVKKEDAKPASDPVADMERKLAELADSNEVGRKQQLALDLRALLDATTEHGVGQVIRLDLRFFEPGLPTMVLARPQTRPEQKRHDDMATLKGVGNVLKAARLLADSCLVYPSREVFDQILAKAPGVHLDLGNRLVSHGQGVKVEEGKD